MYLPLNKGKVGGIVYGGNLENKKLFTNFKQVICYNNSKK